MTASTQSTTNQIDEETPLLPSQGAKSKSSRLPWAQLTIVLVLQLAEPLTSQVIYPFSPQLVRDVGITHGNEGKVGYYVGLLQSLFFFAQAFTVLHWSRISDHIGRRPVIMSGLLGLSLSSYGFGLSKTYWTVVFCRSLTGALNGNIGVIKSMLTELSDGTNVSQLYAYMPIAWATGGTLGPIIGGSLSHPADRFPELFGNNQFLKTYPYFLPCAVPATFALLAWLVTYLFLRETVAAPVCFSQYLFHKKKIEDTSSEAEAADVNDEDKPLPLRSLLIPQVIVAAGNYASLSLVDIAFRAIQPVFYATPVELGGLGLAPPEIGRILSTYGIVNGVFQVCFFAKINRYWGPKKVFTYGILSSFPVFAMFPLLNHLAKTEGFTTTLWILVASQTFLSIGLNLSYGAVFMFIAAASPNRASLGATNGLGQMIVSMMRAIGPAATNSLFSLSIENNYLDGRLVYYVLLGVVCMSAAVATFLPKRIHLQ